MIIDYIAPLMIGFIVFVTVLSLISISCEKKWLGTQKKHLTQVKALSGNGYDSVNDLAQRANLRENSQLYTYLTKSETAALLGNLPHAHHYAYIPHERSTQLLSAVRSSAITSMLIFGLVGTFIKMAALMPPDMINGVLSQPNDQDALKNLLVSTRASLSGAFMPSIVAISSMVVILVWKHFSIDHLRRELSHSSHEFATNVIARNANEKNNTEQAAIAAAADFKESAEQIKTSSEYIQNAVGSVLDASGKADDIVTSLNDSIKIINGEFSEYFGEKSAFIQCIAKLYDVVSPIEDRYKQLVLHLSKLEILMAGQTKEVSKTFKEVAEAAEYAKSSVPEIIDTVEGIFKPVALAAEDWNAAGKKWEEAISKALPMESKRMDEIAGLLTREDAPIPRTLKDLGEELERASSSSKSRVNAEKKLETQLTGFEQQLRQIATNSSASASGPVKTEIANLGNQISSIHGVLNDLEKNISDIRSTSSNRDQGLESLANAVAGLAQSVMDQQKSFADLSDKLANAITHYEAHSSERTEKRRLFGVLPRRK